MTIIPIDLTQDLNGIKLIAQKAFGDTPDASLEEWFSFPEMQKAIEEGKGVCLKAVQDEKIIGMVYAQTENPINGKEGLEKWVIVIAAVDPEMEGKGIGSALLKEIENIAKTRGILKMFVYTNKDDDQVINFYKKNNYKDAGYIKDYQYGKNNSAAFLLKYLN